MGRERVQTLIAQKYTVDGVEDSNPNYIRPEPISTEILLMPSLLDYYSERKDTIAAAAVRYLVSIRDENLEDTREQLRNICVCTTETEARAVGQLLLMKVIQQSYCDAEGKEFTNSIYIRPKVVLTDVVLMPSVIESMCAATVMQDDAVQPAFTKKYDTRSKRK